MLITDLVTTLIKGKRHMDRLENIQVGKSEWEGFLKPFHIDYRQEFNKEKS